MAAGQVHGAGAGTSQPLNLLIVGCLWVEKLLYWFINPIQTGLLLIWYLCGVLWF